MLLCVFLCNLFTKHQDETLIYDIADEENNSDSGGKNAPLREQDRFLPIANIAKIMKRAIPDNGKVTSLTFNCKT